jgi:cobalt-zinc-cadmium efflux system outer membrane protein
MMRGKMRRFAFGMALSLVLFTAGVAGSQGSQKSAQDEFSARNPQLQAYINEALDRNPGIGQSFARYQAALQRMPQVSSLPDPTLGLTQYLRSPETRVGPQTTTLSLSQKLPWFGKLSDKEKVAAKEAASLQFLYEAKRAEVIRQVKLAYYSLGYIDRAIDITNEDLSVLEHFETLARARYEQGVGLQQAVVKLQAEITRDQNRLEDLKRQRVDLEATLNALRDLPSYSVVAKVPQEDRPKVEIVFERLYQIGRDNRPEIQAALLQIERDEKRIQLAHRNYWPDFTVGAGFINVMNRSDLPGILNPPDQNGKNIFSVSASINIPIQRRKYDAAVAEATEDKLASQEGYRNIVNSMEASVRAIGFSIETVERQISLFENTLLPQAEQALRSTEAAYSTGSLGVLDVLDSERVLLDVRLGLAKLNSDYMKSLAEMERAIGAPF